MSELLIKNLSVTHPSGAKAVRDVSLSTRGGEMLFLIGESGCGKTTLMRAAAGLLPEKTRTHGTVFLDGKAMDADERIRKTAYLFQSPLSTLDPAMKVGSQLIEILSAQKPRSRREEMEKEVSSLLDKLGLSPGARIMKEKPLALSGGMRQRAVLAACLLKNPSALLLDEPTTSLDAENEEAILMEVRDFVKSHQIPCVVATHDIRLAERFSDRICVMYAGEVVEEGEAPEVLHAPAHPYTKALLESRPEHIRRGSDFQPIPGSPPSMIHLPEGDPFAPRDKGALEIDYLLSPPFFEITKTHRAKTWHLHPLAKEEASKIREVETQKEEKARVEGEVLVSMKDARITYPGGVTGLGGVDLEIRRGESLGLVGPSGAGKTTLARAVAGTLPLSSGKVERKEGIRLAFIFQDAKASFNPKWTVGRILSEPLVYRKVASSGREQEIRRALKETGLGEEILSLKPRALSGGMAQRVAVARALLSKPDLLIADEPVTGLDASMKGQIMNLLKNAQRDHGFSMIFITHHEHLASWLCGKILRVESAKIREALDA